MRTDTPQPVRLADYTPPAFAIDRVDLDFDLEPSATRVKARLEVRRTGGADAPLVLDGVRLKLVSAAVDGKALAPAAYTLTPETLTIPNVPDAFVLETEVQIDPKANTYLEGLYMSGGRFCTQCEAEGFRKITYWPDRPDVLSRFTVRMAADKAAFPRLLSNGNLMETGDLPGGRHYAVWNDPFPKPCYLFALVAGELDVLEDSFVTMTGRTVQLRIYVDPGQAARAEYAMGALKRSMKWDEEAFGREYDLDLFMIVAVRDFNFGAMENKGLNVFNSSLLLADADTATDANYERIEGVIAHEYFHNWTGDRITCRDWFQLCLKEGLTVFRDQSFSQDMRGYAVQRIKDVKALRARQFAEDAGPMAHPVRPSSYMKIDNFYTATIYEKGSEVIRMLKTLIGPEAFREGHGPLLRALGRARHHGGGLHRLLRRGVGPRPLEFLHLVRTGRHADDPYQDDLRRGRQGARSRHQPGDRGPLPASRPRPPCRSLSRSACWTRRGGPRASARRRAEAADQATIVLDKADDDRAAGGRGPPAGAVGPARLFRPREP